ncbi:autophagy protein Apg5-domain-containing protein [Crepidotus variabilis]|uniref:Autophagy protein 5 n=1 Tax=Crepidotus variabilis TaxID=179855 RepID=A0A9P6JQK5_9AGAR|nr:autophagy protein Apg5-domain-containing protein [Crepidotus variabilis]
MSNYNRPSQSTLRAEKDRNADYNTSLFRRMSWEGTVPLEIRVDPKELPANSDRGLECYFIQAPRISYLPLLVPEIKRFLMDVVFDETAAKSLKDEDWWFESEEGTLLKWHWSIGLLYDNHTISTSLRSPNPPSTSMSVPMRLILHLAAPPNDKLFLSSTIEACKQAFMNQLKEADFVRWGNTRRMVGLRKVDQDGLWEGIKDHNFDDFWRVASKLTPIASGTPSSRPTSPPPGSALSRPGTSDPTTQSDRDSAYSMRNVPIRMYLPDGPVLQELAPPILEDGMPNTLRDFISKHLQLLFPDRPPPPPPSRLNPNPQAPPPLEHAYILIQGVVCPPEAELGWLGACLVGADGWLNICVGITR